MQFCSSNPKTTNIMKRQFLVFGLAFTIAMGMASCKQKSEAPAAAEQAETEQVETKQPSAEEIVAKAKAEGANWSVDEWKASTKDMMIALSPALKKLGELLQKMEAEPDKVAEIMGEMEGFKAEFEPFEKLMNEFEEVAKATVNGKAVMDDEEWGNALKKELGLPDDM
jgi:hypothetical protein